MRKHDFKRVWRRVSEWEEVAHNMWGEVEDRKAWLERAIAFTADHELYGHWMMRVVQDWPVSCENALTDSALNQKAWIGHAACAYAMGCPEDITREAWGHLTDEQRLLANKKAERAIQCWRINEAENRGVGEDLAGAVLL